MSRFTCRCAGRERQASKIGTAGYARTFGSLDPLQRHRNAVAGPSHSRAKAHHPAPCGTARAWRSQLRWRGPVRHRDRCSPGLHMPATPSNSPPFAIVRITLATWLGRARNPGEFRCLALCHQPRQRRTTIAILAGHTLRYLPRSQCAPPAPGCPRTLPFLWQKSTAMTSCWKMKRATSSGSLPPAAWNQQEHNGKVIQVGYLA